MRHGEKPLSRDDADFAAQTSAEAPLTFGERLRRQPGTEVKEALLFCLDLLHFLMLPLLLLTPSVAGACWGRGWGFLLGSLAAIGWLFLARFPYLGEVRWHIQTWGMCAILLQTCYQAHYWHAQVLQRLH